MLELFASLIFLTHGNFSHFLPPQSHGNAESQGNYYQQLRITKEEKQKISTIISTMAENSVFQLLFEKKFLERLGQEVHHVHPLRFLGTIFNDPYLVSCMFVIRTSTFKWGGFLDGITERMKGEIKAGNVNRYVPGMAEQLNLKAEDIQGYINRRDIEGLVVYLMEQKKSSN